MTCGETMADLVGAGNWERGETSDLSRFLLDEKSLPKLIKEKPRRNAVYDSSFELLETGGTGPAVFDFQ